MKKILFILVSIGLLFMPRTTQASPPAQLDRLIQNLLKSYSDSSNAEKRVGVLPFSTSADMAHRNLGFAVSELLTHRLFQSQQFKIVERSALLSVLEEQHFQQTGAVDTTTAVKIGKLSGANFLIAGSAEKLGRVYQVNARLVDIETGEVRATAFEEIAAAELEHDARPYMGLVPERQAISLYALYLVQPQSQIQTHSIALLDNFSVDLKPQDFDLHFFGGGIQYQPYRRIYLDASYLAAAREAEAVTTNPTPYGPASLESGSLVRFLIGYRLPIKKHFQTHLAVGMARYNFNFSESFASLELKETLPWVETGLEWKVQDRFSIGFDINAALGKLQIESTRDGRVSLIEFSALSYGPTMAVYF